MFHPTPPTQISVHRMKMLLSRPHINLYLFIFAIIFSLCDTISTVVCMSTFGYNLESNIFLRWIMHNFGVAGFLVVKMGVTLVVLVVVYHILSNAIRSERLGARRFYGIYLGVILSNAYAGISNISVLLGNGSFYLLNLNVMQMVPLLTFLLLLTVLLFKSL